MGRHDLGNLLTHGVKLELNEMGTVLYFVEKGKNIELIKPSNTPLNKSADFIMDGLIWESKCPSGKSLVTVEHLFRKAVKQSENIVFDLRCFKGDEKGVLKLLRRLFKNSRAVRDMLIIQKNGKLIKMS